MAKKTAIGLLLILILLVVPAAIAAETGEAGGSSSEAKGFIAIACGLGIAVAAFGGAIAQGRAAAAAIEGIARNPGAASKVFTPMILGLALIESLVIYALVVSLILVGKV